MGRPRKIESPEQLEKAANDYFAQCAADEKPITLTGAVRAVGLSSRSTLDDYAEREGFSAPIKRLKLRVEQAYEERLHGNSPTGAIFALKNMGWSDKSQTEITGKDGGPIETNATIDPSKLSSAALRELVNARTEADE